MEYYSKLTPQERRKVREELMAKQEQLCWYCHKPFWMTPPSHIENYEYNMRVFPPTMFKYPVHSHHDHETDVCIGAVHAKCNAYMWETEGK